MAPLRLVITLFKFAFAVGLAGGLVDMTMAMARKAGEAHRVGLVKLGDINRGLGMR